MLTPMQRSELGEKPEPFAAGGAEPGGRVDRAVWLELPRGTVPATGDPIDGFWKRHAALAADRTGHTQSNWPFEGAPAAPQCASGPRNACGGHPEGSFGGNRSTEMGSKIRVLDPDRRVETGASGHHVRRPLTSLNPELRSSVSAAQGGLPLQCVPADIDGTPPARREGAIRLAECSDDDSRAVPEHPGDAGTEYLRWQVRLAVGEGQ